MLHRTVTHHTLNIQIILGQNLRTFIDSFARAVEYAACKTTTADEMVHIADLSLCHLLQLQQQLQYCNMSSTRLATAA